MPVMHPTWLVALMFAGTGFGAAAATGGSNESPLEVTSNMTLDPGKTYGPIIVKTSGVVIDGRGAWLIGREGGKPKEFRGVAVSADGVSNVTLKNVNAKGWEIGLKVRNAKGWTVENCDFSDNFHDPDFGWGENGRRGGIVLEKVRESRFAKNRAHRVWDACTLVDSDENVIENNDFSITSNTCMKLWTSGRNLVRDNLLRKGIRISPGEVHARDSACVLIESGSNDNRFLGNDCTGGGDGVFVRVLNGWSSTGNRFENNDASYANNNGFECWAPGNAFVHNKANHCSYGFWLGGSDKTRLIANEASYNGLPSGMHNSPHLPGAGHAGIVFMFGPSSHTLARDNICEGNNGAGIALIGDLAANRGKWRAYHWILERNVLNRNRWGLYVKNADWVIASGNGFEANSAKDVLLDGDVTRWSESKAPIPREVEAPVVKVSGPTSLAIGENGVWDASGSTDPSGRRVTVTWDLGAGAPIEGPTLTHRFDRVGYHRIGINVSNGVLTEPAWRDVLVVSNVRELGTDGPAEGWSIEDYHDRTPSRERISQALFSLDTEDHVVGNSSLRAVVAPYSGFRAALTYPRARDADWSLEGKTRITFWLKAINSDPTGWQGGPFVAIHGSDGLTAWIEPKEGRDLMRELDNNEEREGWRRFEIPLNGDDRTRLIGKLPAKVKALSLAFDSWGAPPLRIKIDGLAIE